MTTENPPQNSPSKDYARGYQAGRRKTEADITRSEAIHSAMQEQNNAFWRSAFLAALPACITASGWKIGDKPITSMTDRASLAEDFADEAMRIARNRNKAA